MHNDMEIARSVKLKPIEEIADYIGLCQDDLELYGKYKAKISLSVLDRLKDAPVGKYVNVTAITPTPFGEGKTVVTIGLSMALNKIGKKAISAIRQPSMGPTFGIKGGGSGGGYAQVIPPEDVNLHLTGDIHAVTAAHNLLAACLDNVLTKGNQLNIDPFNITWNRVLDINDRALRRIVIGLGGKTFGGVPREAGFDLTAASEVMAILALASGLKDLRERIGKVVVALDNDKKTVTAEEIGCAGAMAALLKEAIKPNLLQTTQNTPCLVHAGPFANIAHGNSSILADKIGLKCADYLVTESGFGADLGFEKFCDIKCRCSGHLPDAAVLVTTVRALKMHSADFKVSPGKPLDSRFFEENLDATERGAVNMIKQIENIKTFGIPAVVAINRFEADTKAEIDLVKRIAQESGAQAAVVCDVWAKGGEGGGELAEAVMSVCQTPKDFRFLYPLDMSIKDKIETIAKKIYGALGVEYTSLASRQITRYSESGFAHLPVCMAKTHLSLSDDHRALGRPEGFTVMVREVRVSAGAGFIYPILGEISTMPGLPTLPAANRIDIDEDGQIVGLS